MADEMSLNVRIPADLKIKVEEVAWEKFQRERKGLLKKATIEALKLWLEAEGHPYKE